MNTDTIERGAIISTCGNYRYRLSRSWSQSRRRVLLWVMLNPSTADGVTDDRTIGRVIEFSRRWGYDAALVGNLYAYRSTDPDELLRLPLHETYGPQNAEHLARMARESERIVFGYGSHAAAAAGVVEFTRNILEHPGGHWCLGRTKSGAPRHPLYVRGDTELQRFEP